MEKKQYNILVIEDNEGDFLLVEEFLYEQFEEVSIIHAKNSRQAFDVLTAKTNSFDVILLDLSLPDKTGIALIYQVISICDHTPVIVLTGYDDFDFGIKSLSLGISDYLLKDELTSLSLYKSIIYSSERKKIASALEASEKRARNFAKQLNEALEEERLRIAREIHDDLGQQFSGLKMSLASVKRLKGFNADIEEIVDGMIRDVDASIQSLRQIANELRPVILDKLGLFAAIEWLVSGFEKKNNIECFVQVPECSIELDKVKEINIFRICQEAFTNIAKHAGASKVKVLIEKLDDELTIKITDNGKGIEKSNIKKSLSMGLINMQERAAFIGGNLDIDSTTDIGSEIKLTLLLLNDNKNILVADDHTAIRVGVKHICTAEFQSLRFGEAVSYAEVFQKLKETDWDILILDIDMPGRNGLDILQQIKTEKIKVPVLMFSFHMEDQIALRALKLGAAGYLSKDAADKELIKAINQIINGRKYVSELLSEKLLSLYEKDSEKELHELLSTREYQTMLLIASGKTVSEIAEILSLSTPTISTYRARILEKMKMKNNSELTTYVISRKLL